MDFGNKLKELRMQNGLTQQQLATQLGVTKSVISFYERQELQKYYEKWQLSFESVLIFYWISTELNVLMCPI